MRAVVVGTASVGAGIAAWWLLARFGGVPAYALPSPVDVLDRAGALLASGSLQLHTAQTLAAVVQGALLGAPAGALLASLLHHVPTARRILMPIVVVLQVTPKISIAPLLVLWIGLGIESKIALVALVVSYPVLVTVLASLDGMTSGMRDLARVLAMSPMRRLATMEIPHATPAFLSGLRLGMLAAVTAAVIGELIGATAGLGFLEKQGQDGDDVTIVMIALIALSGMGLGLYALVGAAERLVTRRYG